MNEQTVNNSVEVMGKIVSDFEFNHEVFGEGFYVVQVEIERLSGQCDTIPVLVSERLIDVKQDYKGQFISVYGQYRSFNKHDEAGNHRLILSVFAREAEIVEEEPNGAYNNTIFLDGYICREPVFRKTPLGREITDVSIAVNRAYGKSDYIPLVFWGRNARHASTFAIGERIQVLGRVQSREYNKKITEEQIEKRIAYEVSVHRMVPVPVTEQ